LNRLFQVRPPLVEGRIQSLFGHGYFFGGSIVNRCKKLTNFGFVKRYCLKVNRSGFAGGRLV
jgi:hypothetical protein